MKTTIITLILIALTTIGFAQKVELLPASRFAAQPVGDEDYISDYIKQELVYPKALYESETEGEVTIRYLVDNEGNVTQSRISSSTNEAFNEEAMRFFNNIVWKVDYTRLINEKLEDGIRIIFSPKQYKKAVKKRGYDQLPIPNGVELANDAVLYDIKQVDTPPKLIGADNMNAFALKNLRYPQEAIMRKIKGEVKYEFVIEPYGLSSNYILVNALAGGCNEETMRIIKLMRWEPAIKDGKAVRTKVQFRLLFNAGGSGSYDMFDGNSNSSN
jgi:TonB family protein